MLCGEPATLSVLIVKVAVPLFMAWSGDCWTPSTKKVTVPPVGVPALAALVLTVAVKVTGWPKSDGVPFEDTAVEVGAAVTTWVKVLVVLLPLKLALSPLNVAVTVWLPA